MTELVLVDTSAWLFALGPRPNPKVKNRVSELVENNLAAMTSPIIFELLSGAQTSSDAGQLAGHLSALHPFPLLVEEWIEAARWANGLRRKGIKIKTIDALIAFKAIKHRLTLLHADSDFDRLARRCPLQVESLVAAVRP